MFSKMKLPDGSVWNKCDATETDNGFQCEGVTFENSCGSNDSWEVYKSNSGDLVAIVTWFPLYEYVGGTLYNSSGESLAEFFVQDESAESFFKLSRANMVKQVVYMLHEICP